MAVAGGADALAGFVREVGQANTGAIEALAQRIVAAHAAGALVYVAGAGHSLNAVTEAFFRAGGLAGVRPLWHPRILPLNGALASTAAEREPGLGASVAAQADFGADDVVVVFSTSGINPYPVEIAQTARAAGAYVAAITAVHTSRATRPRGEHRLLDVADLVIDTCVPKGDVSYPADAPLTAPLSSLANVVCWTLVLQQVADLAPDMPFWRSANVPGNDEANESTFARVKDRIPELG